MHDPWNERLSEYIDGELVPQERAALEAHLRTCDVCRDDVDGLRAVVARARTLRDTAPEAELWPQIATRIGARSTFPAPRPAARQFTFTLTQLIAASLALIVLSGGMVWLARLGGSQTDFPPLGAESETVRPATFADRSYEEAIADLQQALQAGRRHLDPQTVQVLEANVQAIDRAIAQCREALASDPANVYLNTYFAEVRAKKLELLRQAAALVDRVKLKGRG